MLIMWQVELNKKVFGPRFKKDAKAVEERLVECSNQKEREQWSAALAKGEEIDVLVEGLGKLSIAPELLKVEQRTRTENGQ